MFWNSSSDQVVPTTNTFVFTPAFLLNYVISDIVQSN